MKNIVLYILIIVILTAVQLFYILDQPEKPKTPKQDLQTPSPAFGQLIATSLHQALTDPYLKPLEELTFYLRANHRVDEISVDMITKWAPDNLIPTGFVYNVAEKSWQIDHPTSPWVLEGVLEFLKQGLTTNPVKGRVSITELVIEEELYWLGYLRIPADSYRPNQIAGVFFSVDDYLDEHIPRFIDNVTERRRFPIASFQQNPPVDMSLPDGHISFRVIDENGETYLQHGRNFNTNQMIYAESAWYDNPIVCMQRGWDLQIFSSNKPVIVEEIPKSNRMQFVILILSLIFISVFFWWAVGKD